MSRKTACEAQSLGGSLGVPILSLPSQPPSSKLEEARTDSVAPQCRGPDETKDNDLVARVHDRAQHSGDDGAEEE